MNTAKVSVIIPNYNHGKFLRRRIDSVLNQTYRNIEIIILDDCSTDGSRDIIEQYRSNPFVKQIIFNTVNSGSPFIQWECGIHHATGDWIWIAESDDYADTRFLESLLSTASSFSNVGLVYCDSHIVTDDDVISPDTFALYKNSRFNTERWNSDHFNSGIDEIEKYLLPAGTINNSSAVLFNRRMLLTTNPFDLGLKLIGDKYAFIRILQESNVVYIKEALNYFRNPFNSKHVDKDMLLFREQFLVFDWVYRNLPLRDKKKFFEGFYENTRNSLFRRWNGSKLSVYRNLLALNSRLFLRNILYNFWQPIGSIFQHR